MTIFRQEYMVEWATPAWGLLEALAMRYHTNTEDHDHHICRYRKRKMAMPATPEERAACIQFARDEFRRLNEIALSQHAEPGALWRAIKRVEREWQASYVPPATSCATIALDTPPHPAHT